jgi:F-type H+-transporting ATPase subunit alpha
MIFGHDFQYYQETFGEIGFVESTRHPLLNVSGLPGAFIDEVILFENNDIGVVTALNNAMLEVSSFGVLPISLKTKAVRTGSRIKFPVGDSMLGKVLSPLGHSKYAEDPFHNVQEYVDIYTEIKTIKNRKKITEPYYTGVSIVDLLLPLGKGQRELVIGDKQTGKTSFLTQICNSQYKNNNITVYCCIGKTKADIKKIVINSIKKPLIWYLQ